MVKTAIECQHISKCYAETVLSNISLSIETGSTTGIIGLNGAGKTTLIKIILGLAPSSSGEARIFGQPGNTPEAREFVMFLPEKFQPSPYLKGREQIAYALSFYGQPYAAEKAESYCRKLGLAPLALESYVKTYSKGMTQKLGLITAMMTDTPLLILDEPMSGLDPKARIQLRNTLQEQRESGRTIVFTSHILADIDCLCDHLAVIHKGKLVYSGSLDTFRGNNDQSTEQAFMKVIGEEQLAG